MVDSTYKNEFNFLKTDKPDVILQLYVQYLQDTCENKVNLGIGAYRTEEGVPYIFDVVKKAERKVIEEQKEKEYLPVQGNAVFTQAARGLLFGQEHKLVTDGTVASCQTVAGSGALSMGLEFLKRTRPSAVYITDPTWANHRGMISQAGLVERTLRYYNPETKSLEFDHFLEDLNKAQHGSIVLLQPCAHNPTGVDPSPDQWIEIAKVMKERHLFPFLDCAYQGFGTGCVEKDAFAVRHFADQGFQMIIT
jgi:aspartate aminotransferase